MPKGFYPTALPHDLPHPRVSLRVFLILEAAIRTAWEELLKVRPEGFDPETAKENEFTRHLWSLLANNYLPAGKVPGFTREVFAAISRGEEIPNFSGSNPDKKPDFVVRFNFRRSRVQAGYDGIFVEAKPVGPGHPVPACYFKEGIKRFVRGDYAWAMQEALMLGYVFGEADITLWLKRTAEPRFKLHGTGHVEACANGSGAESSQYCLPVHVTHHLRTFPYEATNQIAPPITVRHLWLIRPQTQMELLL